MKILSRIHDDRINAENIFIEMPYQQYIHLAENILKNNPLQRKRIKSSNTVYSLLKNDIKIGAIIPPVVLAMSSDSTNIELEQILAMTDENVIGFISENKEQLIILDGLQRTHTIFDLIKNLEEEGDSHTLRAIEERKIRVEIYVGLNKFGILYRMLTLNTGQTPMSLRHQIEMLYGDLSDIGLAGIDIIKEVDDASIDRLGKYKYQDVIEGFNSYLERNELPITKSDLLNNIKSLDKLSLENQYQDLFKDFIETYDYFVQRMNLLLEEWNLDEDEQEQLNGQAFGNTIYKIFSRTQSITGFGAAIGKLKDYKLIRDFVELRTIIDSLGHESNVEDGLIALLKNLDKIRSNSKKIGNGQRLYFQYFYRDLFNQENDSFKDLELAAETAYKKYESQVV